MAIVQVPLIQPEQVAIGLLLHTNAGMAGKGACVQPGFH